MVTITGEKRLLVRYILQCFYTVTLVCYTSHIFKVTFPLPLHQIVTLRIYSRSPSYTVTLDCYTSHLFKVTFLHRYNRLLPFAYIQGHLSSTVTLDCYTSHLFKVTFLHRYIRLLHFAFIQGHLSTPLQQIATLRIYSRSPFYTVTLDCYTSHLFKVTFLHRYIRLLPFAYIQGHLSTPLHQIATLRMYSRSPFYTVTLDVYTSHIFKVTFLHRYIRLLPFAYIQCHLLTPLHQIFTLRIYSMSPFYTVTLDCYTSHIVRLTWYIVHAFKCFPLLLYPMCVTC